MVQGVRLPQGSRCPHYWATDLPDPDAAELADRLAAVFTDTGLWPVLWGPFESPDHYAAPKPEQDGPDWVHVRDTDDTGWQALGGLKEGFEPAGGVAGNGRIDRPFQAAASAGPNPPPEEGWILILVPAQRPADVIDTLGVIQSELITDDAVAAVVRSWETRFSAVVTTMFAGELDLMVGAPPKTEKRARAVAREHIMLAPEAIDESLDTRARALLTDGVSDAASPHSWSFGWPD